MNSPDASLPDVTILVPALNEEATIQAVIERLLAVPLRAQIVVIDDGSRDETPKRLASFGESIEVITNPVPGGKGAAIRRGLETARGRVVVIQDADLEYFPEEIPSLVEPILRGDSRVVLGSRFTEGMHRDMAWPNKIVNALLVWSVRLLFGGRLKPQGLITDEATCYKAIDRELLVDMNLECQRFEFCPEVVAKTYRFGERPMEVPVRYVPRSKEAGKKIRWTDAPEAFWTLLKWRFKPVRKSKSAPHE